MNNMIKLKISCLLIAVIMIIASTVGWGLNVYKLCKLDFEPSYKAEIIRAIAIPTGLGCIVGYIKFQEEIEQDESKEIQ